MKPTDFLDRDAGEGATVAGVDAAPRAARPLLDVLGARWKIPAPAASVAWDIGGTVACFGLADGAVALAPSAWDGAAALRPRPGGGVELVAGNDEPPSLSHVMVHDGACLSVAADPDGGFLSGGEDGRVVRVQASGVAAETVGQFGRAPVVLVVAGRGGWRACASGSTVHRIGHGTSRIAVSASVLSLALDPAGARLALGLPDGVVLWAGGDTPRRLPARGPQAMLAWSNDSQWLASATPDGALRFWRLADFVSSDIDAGGPVSNVAALVTDVALVAGVGGRVLCWRPNGAGTAIGTPVLCGIASQTSVTRVACHPHRAVIASGYANGTVALCQPGAASMLFLRGAGEGAVSALAFAPAGDVLALATDGGEVAIVPTPDALFREGSGSP